jgi:LysM repeat protein
MKILTNTRAVLSGIVVAGVAAAGLALGAAPANAAPLSVWDRVAQCESSGNWHINTGNGYYGGLQFTLSTWHGFGGVGNPANASKSQQIAVAERVLASQGWGAWPVCSVKAGATGYSPSSHTTVAAPKAVSAPKAPTHRAVKHRATVAVSSRTVTVRSGDTLSKIAARHGITWHRLWAANPSVGNPNLIYAGQALHLPA